MSKFPMRLSAFFLVAIGALAACGTRPPETPVIAIHGVNQPQPKVTHETSGTSSQECVAREVTVGLDLEVAPSGVEAFVIRARQMPMRVHVTDGITSHVEVGGPVAFEGTMKFDEEEGSGPHLFAARELVLDDGLVTLGKGVHVIAPRRNGPHVFGTVAMGGLKVMDVDIPCDGLGVGTPEWPANLEVDDEATTMIVQPGGARLCARATENGKCVKLDAGFPLVQMSSKDGWIELRTKFDDGSALHGWARKSEVATGDAPLMGIRGGSGGCGCGSRVMLRGRRSGPIDPREHHGSARIKAGAKIFATEDGRAGWATVKKDIVVDIHMDAEATHAQLTELPNISETPGCDCDGMNDHAWVAREHVVPIR